MLVQLVTRGELEIGELALLGLGMAAVRFPGGSGDLEVAGFGEDGGGLGGTGAVPVRALATSSQVAAIQARIVRSGTPSCFEMAGERRPEQESSKAWSRRVWRWR